MARNWKSLLIFSFTLLPSLVGSRAVAEEPIPPHVRTDLSQYALEVARGNNAFALDIYRDLSANADSGENLLVSPLSISTALAMTYAGARGDTAAEIADTLHFDLPSDHLHAGFGELIEDLNQQRPGYQLSLANRLFGQQSYAFEQAFLDRLAAGYNAPLEELDFITNPEPSREYINRWVEAQTNDKIKNLLPQGSVDTDTRLVLTNAVYFNGKWKHQFEAELTQAGPFYSSADTEVTVPMMYQERKFNYAALENFQMLEMPYAGDDLSMVVMLPHEIDGLKELEASLSPEVLQESFEAMHTAQVRVHLPRFTFDDSFNLSEVLRSMGIEEAFSDQADFSGISDGELAIQSVVHKTFIDVNEKGTEAAAATGVVVGTTSVDIPVDFRADHPFLFALRDTHSGSLMFLGRVADPAKLVAVQVPESSSLALCLLGMICAASGGRKK